MNTNPTFREDHFAEPFQLFIAISGENREAVKKALAGLLADMASPNGKPLQGRYLYPDHNLEVITPKWGGTDY